MGNSLQYVQGIQCGDGDCVVRLFQIDHRICRLVALQPSVVRRPFFRRKRVHGLCHYFEKRDVVRITYQRNSCLLQRTRWYGYFWSYLSITSKFVRAVSCEVRSCNDIIAIFASAMSFSIQRSPGVTWGETAGEVHSWTAAFIGYS